MSGNKRVGFIGLGRMGRPMVGNLLKKGFSVTIFGRKEDIVRQLKALGASAATSAKELAKASDVVISMVRDDTETNEVLRGQNGVLAGIKAGSYIVISSTIDPVHCREIAAEAKTKGVDVLDAPVSGVTVGAEAGTLTFMVGGNEKALEACRPVLEAMGTNIVHTGKVGSGQVAKLINNFLFLVNLAGLSEGIGFGLKAGLKVGPLIDIIKTSSGSSWSAHNWETVLKLKNDYDENGRSSGLGLLMYKDVDLALQAAKRMDYWLPLVGLCAQSDMSRLFPGLETHGNRNRKEHQKG